MSEAPPCMWLTGQNAAKLVREYEIELDNHYRSLPFWSIPIDNRTYWVLAAYDTLSLCHQVFATDAAMAWRQKMIEDGLSHCLRWILLQGRTFGIAPSTDPQHFDLAAPFLVFASVYQELVDIHVSFSQSLLNADVNPTERIVRFTYDGDVATWQNSIGVFENYGQVQEAAEKSVFVFGSQVDRPPLRQLAVHSTDIRDGRIILTDVSAIRNTELESLTECGDAAVWIPIPPEARLNGFTFAELRMVWRVLLNWSILLLGRLHIEHENGLDRPTCYPTQFCDRTEMVELLAEASQVSKATAHAIVTHLTYDMSDKKGDVFLSPLLPDAGGVLWSPRVVIGSSLGRNTLKLMARRPILKPIADDVIGNCELPMLQALRTLLVKRGYQCKLRTRVGVGAQHGEIDVLAWTSRAPSEILVIECKFVLPPDDVNEVKDLTEKLLAGQIQLRRVLGLLDRAAASQKQDWFRFVPWGQETTTFAVVVNNQGSPNHVYDHSDIPTVDFVFNQATLLATAF